MLKSLVFVKTRQRTKWRELSSCCLIQDICKTAVALRDHPLVSDAAQSHSGTSFGSRIARGQSFLENLLRVIALAAAERTQAEHKHVNKGKQELFGQEGQLLLRSTNSTLLDHHPNARSLVKYQAWQTKKSKSMSVSTMSMSMMILESTHGAAPMI